MIFLPGMEGKMNLKKISLFLLLLLPLGLFGNGLNLNSLGSKALSMGGAFVGLADDFSAAFWNPAGIAQFETSYLGFYFTDVIPSGSYRNELLRVDASFTKHYPSGMIAFYSPISENFFAGLAVYVPSGLGSSWKGKDFAVFTGGTPLEWMSKIGLITISPVIAYKVSEKVFFGASFNVNYGMMELKTSANSQQYSESSTGWGVGATLGVLIKASDYLSLGLTARTASKVSLKGTITMEALKAYSHLGVPTESDFSRDITWPIWIGFGVALKPSEKVTITADLQWTQWSVEDVIITDFKSNMWNILFAMTPEKEEEMKFNWKDAAQLRFGFEYLINEKVAVRGGYYYDPTPAPDETMNVLLPSFTFNVVTFGVGITMDKLVLDVGVEYLMGKERKVEPTPDNMPGTYNMNIFVPTFSISYRF